jgi:ATP-dependent helicase HrpB
MPSDPLAPALPVLMHAERIVRQLRESQRLVLVAETGSGKTTQVPQILARAGFCDEGRIVVLQPRRLAARAVARRVAHEMGEREGDRVGWRTRFDRNESARTRILFLTDGLFVRMATARGGLEGISTVIVDEFHERGLSSDLAVGLVLRAQAMARPNEQHGDVRHGSGGQGPALVVMSATLDAARVARSLEVEPLQVEGRLHPVTVEHRADGSGGEDSCARAAREALDAADRFGGDGLVFLPGRGEIARTLEMMRGGASSIEVLPLHGAQQPEEQDRVFAPCAKRRVILATNIAETSLTIPGIRWVIDSGVARIHRFDMQRDLNALRIEPISQASAAQRAGRAGRTGPGACVRLWSTAAHARRAAFDTPEVHRIDLSEAVLSLRAAGLEDLAAFPWIDAPTSAALTRSERVLRQCGAVGEDGALTADGRAMARIPAHPRLARALLEGARRGVSARVSWWAALLSERDPFEREDEAALRGALERADLPGDLTARERAWHSWKHGGRGRVDSLSARELERAAAHLQRSAESCAPGVVSRAGDRDDDAEVAAAFMLGFPDRVGWRIDAQRPHASMRGRRKVSIDRSSLHQGAGPLLAFDVRQLGEGDSAQTVLSMVNGLKVSWVESTLPERFTIERHERWDSEREAVVSVEERMFDDVVIDATVRPPRNTNAAADVIAAQMIADGRRPDDWDERSVPWITRVRWVAALAPERRLDVYGDQDLQIVFAEWAAGATRWSEVRGRPSLGAVQGALSYEDRRFVEQMAPSDITLPRGFRMRLQYEPGQPVRGAAKIQDLYGLEASPCVGGGRIPVLLEILGPHRRPLQVTSDLPAFWRVLYPQLRPELRRRYPRHEWR